MSTRDWKRSDIPTLLVLEAFDREDAADYVDDRLMRWTGAPEKVVHAAMEREKRRDFVDYGLWLRGGWLTEAGRARLTELRAEASDRPLSGSISPATPTSDDG